VTPSGDAIPFSALTAIHYVHRLSAYAVFLGLGLAAWSLWRTPALRRVAQTLALLALWQLASGLANVVLDWPMLAAIAHTGGAAALVVAMTGVLFATQSASPQTSGAPAYNNLSRATR
jgi:heme a synthase